MSSAEAKPKSLKLEFSKAADIKRISRLFEPEVREAADPHHYVAKRLSSAFNKAVAAGCAAFLSDETGALRTMTIAYHAYVEKDAPADAQHDYTELGSSLSLIPGYRSSMPVIAALALREWFKHPPAQKITAEINQKNAASIKVYKESLEWEVVADKAQLAAINKASWRTVPDESDPTGQTGLEKVPEDMVSADWFECNKKVLVKQAQIVLAFMKQGGVINKKNGDFIPVDFSALKKEGLTRSRLEAIAHGVTSRVSLAKLKA